MNANTSQVVDCQGALAGHLGRHTQLRLGFWWDIVLNLLVEIIGRDCLWGLFVGLVSGDCLWGLFVGLVCVACL